MVEDLGARLTLGVAQDPVAVVQVAVELHVPDSHEAVEPGVGDGLHGLVKTMGLDANQECFTRLNGSLGECMPPYNQHITLHDRGCTACSRNAQLGSLSGDGFDEVATRFGCVATELSGLHQSGSLDLHALVRGNRCFQRSAQLGQERFNVSRSFNEACGPHRTGLQDSARLGCRRR